VGGFFLASENPTAALAWLRGESITIEPSTCEIGNGAPGETREFWAQLRNQTPQEVRIVGGTKGLMCNVTRDLPVTLPPYGSRAVTVHAMFASSEGRFRRRFVLFTDDDRQRVVVGQYSGRVIAPID
jgi:hypothetical protein